jgi:hypothetical protein
MLTQLVAVSVIVVAGGCSSDDDEADGADVTSPAADTSGQVDTTVETTAPVTAPVTQPAPTSAPTITSPGPPIIEIELLGSPDYIVADDHGVWVRGEPGLVSLIDPSTNTKAGEVSVGGEPCQGLGAGAGSIFTCAGSDIVRIDPQSMAVVATYPVGKAYSQGELAVSGNTLWVLLGDGSQLLPIDLDTDTPGTPIALPVRGTDLGLGEAGLWVTSAVDDTVLHLDPATGALLHTVGVPNSPFTLAVETDVWAMAAEETVRIDPATGVVDLIVPVGGGDDGSVALSPGVVWVHGADVLFTKIDRSSATLIADPELEVAGAEIAARMTSAGDSIYAFGSIWATAHDDARVFRVPVE